MAEKFNIIDIDKVIHEKVRLAIMTILSTHQQATFKHLKEHLKITDGNLNSHLKVLEENNYLKVKKEFINRKPQTTYSLTKKGKEKFLMYISNMEKIIKKIKEN